MLIGIIGAVLFACLAGTANVLFALQLGHDEITTAFWVGVAVASTIWTVGGLNAVAAQWRAGQPARAYAALMLLLLALGYDALAAYGLSRSEQRAKIAIASSLKSTAAAISLRVERLQHQLSALPITDAAQARALVQASPVTPAQCAMVAGPNKLRRAPADRLRAACSARTAALAALATAQSRERLEGLLAAAQREQSTHMASAAPYDARIELLPAAFVAWAPVLLITSGGLLAAFAAGHASSPAPQIEPPSAPTQPIATDLDATELAIVELVQQPRKPLQIENGWVRGTQRALADLIGAPVTRTNKAIRRLAETGLLKIDTTGNGTALKLATAV